MAVFYADLSRDAVERGMDQDYVDKYIRKFVLEID